MSEVFDALPLFDLFVVVLVNFGSCSSGGMVVVVVCYSCDFPDIHLQHHHLLLFICVDSCLFMITIILFSSYLLTHS